MKRNRILTNKYLLLALVLIAMLALSGCRTRITNNNEVSNVKYDEEGFLSETYQMRRDELGLSIAERPLMPDLGNPEDDEEEGESETNEELNVTPEEDNYVEPPTTKEAQHNANNNNRNTTPRRQSRDDDDDEEATIFFDANKGTIDGKPVKDVDVKVGTMFNSPPTPTRDGYKGITGWYTAPEEGKGKKITFPYKVEDDIFLYAHWGDVTVTFNANGGKVDGLDSKTTQVKKGSKLKFPNAPSLKNNTFKGWHTDPEKNSPVKEGKVINESLVLYAHWEGIDTRETVIVTFDANGGSFGGNKTQIEVKVKKGEAANAPGDPAREGYSFDGWNGDFSNVQSNLTVKANWKKEDEFKISFDGNGGPGASEIKGKVGTIIELPSPNTEKDGYTFGGWSTSKEGSDPLPAGSEFEIKEDVIFYAKWDPNEEDYKYWDDQFDKAPKPSISPKCYVTGGNDDGKNLVKASNAEILKEEDKDKAEYVIVYSKDGADVEKIKADYSGKPLLILPQDAYSSDSFTNEYKTVYKTMILKWLKEDTALDYNDIARKLKLIGEEDSLAPYYDSKAEI